MKASWRWKGVGSRPGDGQNVCLFDDRWKFQPGKNYANHSAVRITNLNPDADIGASSWLVEMEGRSLLLDAGTHPRREAAESLPLFEAAAHLDIEAVSVSHCHLDHVGGLPVALKRFPHSRVFMTDLSYFLVERVLHNSVNVMTRQRDERGIKGYPLYTHEEVDDFAAVFDGLGYRREVEWARPNRGRKSGGPYTLEFHDAGHTMGSAGTLVKAGRRSLFFSGDVCFHDQTLLRAAQFNGIKAEALIVETTRGAQPTPRGFSRAAEVKRLASAIHAVQARKGGVLIPAFALGRTQEMLAAIALMMRAGQVRRQPVYIGGLGRVFTEIYDLQSKRTHRHHPDLKLIRELNLVVVSADEIRNMPLNGRLFVLTSGMVVENTAAYEVALRMLEDPRHGIFFVGYSDPAAPGGRLRAAGTGGQCRLGEDGRVYPVRCEVDSYDLTAHAQRQSTLAWIGKVNPRTVILAHGDAAAREWFTTELKRRHPRMTVVAPGPGESVEIPAGTRTISTGTRPAPPKLPAP